MSDYTLADVRAAVGGLYIRVDCLFGGRRGKLPACLAQYDGRNDRLADTLLSWWNRTLHRHIPATLIWLP